MDLNISLDSAVNASIAVAVTPSRLVTSTPRSSPFKVPARVARRTGRAKAYVRPVCDTCNVCRKEYRCHRSFVNHMRQHSIKDASSKHPSATLIIEHCSLKVFESIEALSAYPASSAMGEKYRDLLSKLKSNSNNISINAEWNDFLKIIHESITNGIGEKKILMPSALVNILIKNSQQLLTNREKRKNLCDLLQVCVESDPKVCDFFICDYALLLVKIVVKFYSSCLRDSRNAQQSNEREVSLDVEDKEAIHFISGAVVRGFYRKSLQFPKNTGWCNIMKVITGKLLESETVPGPPAIVKGWTIAMNKGKLFFVSGLLFDFFVGVAEILEKTTHNKVRVDRESVIELVCQSGVVLLWDEAVSDSLSENASFDLMCGMTRSFCNTYGVGKAKKFINNFRKYKAEASIPLRHKVAPKT